jgi:hypothetical protein
MPWLFHGTCGRIMGFSIMFLAYRLIDTHDLLELSRHSLFIFKRSSVCVGSAMMQLHVPSFLSR